MEHIYSLKTAVVAKTLELEASIENGKTNSEILSLYKQLKELKYQIIQAELAAKDNKEELEKAL